MEDDEGGSSQDKLESDFIDDTCEEQIVHKKKRVLKKGQIDSSEEEEFGERSGKQSKSKTNKRAQNSKNNKKVVAPPTKKNAIIHEDESEEEKKEEEVKLEAGGADEMKDDEEDEDDEDPYPKLTALAEGQEAGGFKYNAKQKEYVLTDYFALPSKIYERLFEHQKRGVIWLYNLYRERKGGVLGDDMGLGKTVQVATLCKGLFDAEHISKVLIVVPATMKIYWQNELQKWCPGVQNVMQFDDKKKANREQQMRTLRKKGGILVTSYGMVTSEKINLSEMRYDLVVVDEGHKAKNINTELRRNLVALRVKGIRLVLSGTPL